MRLVKMMGIDLRLRVRNRYLLGLWIAIALAIAIWVKLDAPGWDVKVYRQAIASLQVGHDPYEDAMRIERMVYNSGPIPPGTDPPYSYVYPPITLPVLWTFGLLPPMLAGAMYWLTYFIAILTLVWFGLFFAQGAEKPVLLYLAPIAMFFPGLLQDGTVLSGNIAHVLYAAILAGAIFGWRFNRWKYFFFFTLVASCIKAPFLTLLLIPAFSARKQWRWVWGTAMVAMVIQCFQFVAFSSLFVHYLQTINLMFTLNRDFGCGPAGLFADWLEKHHQPYLFGIVFYLIYAVPLVLFLSRLSKRYFSGDFTLKQWLPVLLLGVFLLNPRLIEYDVAPLTLAMVLIAWRAARSHFSAKTTGVLLALLFVIVNAVGLIGWNMRKKVDGLLLVTSFLLGSLMLFQRPLAMRRAFEEKSGWEVLEPSAAISPE